MKRPIPKWNKDELLAEVTAAPPDAERYVPEGMIQLTVRPWIEGDNAGTELLAPTGHSVYPTLIGVHCQSIWSDGGSKSVGTVHWATPEAVAQSAEIYAGKVARGEVSDREAPDR